MNQEENINKENIDEPNNEHTEMKNEPAIAANEVEEGGENEDIFEGDYEEFIEQVYTPQAYVNVDPQLEDLSTMIKIGRAHV